MLHQNMSDMFETVKEDIFSPLDIDRNEEKPEAYWYLLRIYLHLQKNAHDFTIIINRRYELNIKGLLNDFWNDSFLSGIKKAAPDEVDNRVLGNS
ncbi:hypothetical protein P9D34_04985 [Bacillus swezeyi]|uniref:hypothetical protein n=1 Tax=Bacillus swezeyi TaxID=1925020 RepID=UPI001EFAE4F6|nr:hypothetical protein [Bacillus swezeyi]MEC1259811.1 hypothetical protein [Bacillus swezeyi]MED2930077.1 hypothetical protein [Bacillus swezeyi]MED2963034.1 hypothetical protein [Bacillus swezeyi]MED3074242.1 hypothetical protein [Bacillus swezeyi]MED3083492.1 hypothetical protein [Bacillus swezeyi]